MNLRSPRSRSALLIAIAIWSLTGPHGSPARAATITWGTAQNIVGDSDVITTGNLVYAYNFGGNTFPPTVTTATVNGVTFTAFPINGFFGVFSATIGNVTVASTESFIGGSYITGSAPFSGLSTEYQSLVGHYFLKNRPPPVTLTLGGLNSGRNYDFQWWANASAPASGSDTTTATAGNSIGLLNPFTEGGLGQYAIGGFTASGTQQLISFSNTSGFLGIISGFQLRTASTPLIWNTTNGTWNTANTVWTTSGGGTLAFNQAIPSRSAAPAAES